MNAFIDKMRRRAGRYLDVRAEMIQPARGVLSLSFDDIPASALPQFLRDPAVMATASHRAEFPDGDGLSESPRTP